MRMRKVFAPRRRWIPLVMFPILLFPLANGMLGWNLIGGLDREAIGASVLQGLVYTVLVVPTHDELETKIRRKKRGIVK